MMENNFLEWFSKNEDEFVRQFYEDAEDAAWLAYLEGRKQALLDVYLPPGDDM